MPGYAKPVANDKNGVALDSQPLPLKALVTVVSENAVVSSVITLNDNTTDIEIAAVGSGAFIRWIARSDTQGSVLSAAGGTANYDAFLQSGQTKRFIVPIEQLGTSSIVGANIRNGLYNRLAYKGVGIGSVLSNQY